MPAVMSFLLSVLFTIYAISHPDTAGQIAVPVGFLAVLLLLWQHIKGRSHA